MKKCLSLAVCLTALLCTTNSHASVWGALAYSEAADANMRNKQLEEKAKEHDKKLRDIEKKLHDIEKNGRSITIIEK